MEELLRLAERQHALFGRWQSSALGVDKRALATRLRRGEIEYWTGSDRVLRVCGATRTPEQDLMAAVLDGGPGAVATLEAGSWLWKVPGAKAGTLDVIRPRGEDPRPGARTRWPRRLPPQHVTVVRGIPVVTLPRLIFELAGSREHARKVARIIDTIDGRTPSLLVALHQMLPEIATKGKPGITLMRELLAARPPDRVRLTGMERRFEWCLTSVGLRVPRRQVDIGGHSWIGRVDYYDDPIKVIYEVDSELHHLGLLDRRNDERRDAEALAAGFNEVVRITEEELWYDPPTVRRKVTETRRKWTAILGLPA